MSWISHSAVIGLYGEKLLMRRLVKQAQKINFDDLSEKTKTDFLGKMGITEHQYLSCLYGQENAEMILRYNAPNHYRKAFAKFALGQSAAWNWAALSSSLWLVYRKAPYYALIVAVSGLLLFLASHFSTQMLLENPATLGDAASATATMAEGLVSALVSIFTIVLSLILYPLYLNRFLLKYFAQQIKQDNYVFFSKKGPDLPMLWIVILIGLFFSLLSVLRYFPELIKASVNSTKLNDFNLSCTLSITLIEVLLLSFFIIYRKHQMRSAKKSIAKV